MIRLHFIIITILLTMVIPPSFSELSGDRVVSEIIEAYGGKETLLTINTIYAHGKIDDFLREKSGNYARMMRRPDALTISIMPEQGGETRVLNGDRGWQGSTNRLREATPLSVSSMKYQYAYLDLPMSIVDGSAIISSVEIGTLYGKQMILLLVDKSDTPQLRVYVDPESKLIKRVEADFSMRNLGSMQLGTEYENYKSVSGVQFPFTLNNFAGGKISVITLRNIYINKKLPDNTFNP